MKVWFILLFYFSSFGGLAVVKRHDVPPEKYALKRAPGFLIDMPHEGHGALISSQWVVTVAHTIFYDYVGKSLVIGSRAYEIEKVHIHPAYEELRQELLQGDLAPLMSFFQTRSDIALIKLSSPVIDVEPINLYLDKDEKGKTITVYGKGATGDGLSGEEPATKSIRKLNHFQNIVESTESNWLTFKFDQPGNGLTLEGMHGSGDSGGPSIIFQDGDVFLVGLSSWQLGHGDISKFKGGLYGTTGYQVRISNYGDWIMSILNNKERP